VLQLLGLRPNTQIALGFTLESLGEITSPTIDVRTLVRHPEVLSALAQVEEQEAALEIAIRQQYPDLKLGPVYANEEGLNRLGFTAGITLPLWNRNRQAIAEAKGAREETRQSAIDTWKNLVCEAATAAHALATRLAHQPPHAGDVAVADQLLAAGELSSSDYLSFREETLDLTLAEADWLRETHTAALNLNNFNVDLAQ
jgi:outer membrane protein TolC